MRRARWQRGRGRERAQEHKIVAENSKIEWTDHTATGRQLGAYKSAAAKIGCSLVEWFERTSAGFLWCSDCRKWKPAGQFHVDVSRKRGRQQCCVDCASVRHRRSRYSLSRGELSALSSATCPICRRDGQKMEIDHDHRTGDVRGFLCSRCNGALGQFCDDVGLLKTAIAYLEKHNG